MTVHYAPGYAAQRATDRNLLAVLAYIAFLLLIFVGLDPFSPPPAVSQFGGASRGDAMRQVSFVAVTGLVMLAAYQRRGMAMLRAIPLSMALLMGWCLLSALWSMDPGVVMRRAVLQTLIVLSALISVEMVGPRRAFEILRVLLGIVLIVNILSIPVIADARHSAAEIDTALIGNWRGLYGHKNIAGAVAAMTVILFLFTRTGAKNWFGILMALAAAFFLVMTRSKSSMGFLLPALLAGWLYHLSWRDGLSRAILVAGTLLFLCGLASWAILDAETISRQFQNPEEFTGRSAIWAAEIAYIRDHPFLGSGFGTFADTGGASPLAGYINSAWMQAVSHGHNGYLQLLVTIGGVGFVLVMAALVIRPFGRFWAMDGDDSAFKPMLFAIFVFLLLHNIMESDFLEGGSAWVSLLLMIAALDGLARENRARQLPAR
jgi:O-antigen ligase